MRKIEIDLKQLSKWMQTTWNLYASQTIGTDRNLLRFYVNLNQEYKVTFNNEIIYEGCLLFSAIAAWDRV